MRQINDVRELYGMVPELLVEAVCPMCENIVISTMSQAEMVLIFGCTRCANIEKSTLTQMNIPIRNVVKNVPAECID